MFFVELYSEELIEQRREPERLEAEQLGCDARIEDVSCVPAVILVQQSQVVVGVVEHDLDGWILEHLAESGGCADGKWIDDRAPLTRGDLEEIDSIDESVEARAFGVERDLAYAGNVVEEELDLVWSVDVLDSLGLHHVNLKHRAQLSGKGTVKNVKHVKDYGTTSFLLLTAE